MADRKGALYPWESGDSSALSISLAQSLDKADPLRSFRTEFIIPTKADLKRKTVAKGSRDEDKTLSVYLCGNSLGLQPLVVSAYIDVHLKSWASKGVYGHFVEHADSPLSPWSTIDDAAAKSIAPIVGAFTAEVAVMGTLTANLHLLMSSFYTPDEKKHKIIIEQKAFPSDYYAVESQIVHRGFDPATSLITIPPISDSDPTFSVQTILDIITAHADTTALILLPGIQYYTGQLFPMKEITAHAHSHGVLIGWDLAHAVGNVELRLHDWDVDFAVWCTYKYLNAGPGAVGGLFVHDKHDQCDDKRRRPRLSGWWGTDIATRFDMESRECHIFLFYIFYIGIRFNSLLCISDGVQDFEPRPGASGYQLSNPSALDLSALLASLTLFHKATLPALRQKSRLLTAYLSFLLTHPPSKRALPYRILTPPPPYRGAQLSIMLESGLLQKVIKGLEERGVVVDERKPDVIRVAPTPMYNSFEDCLRFARAFWETLGLEVDDTTAQTGLELGL